jgi:hypothetical protein
MSQEVPPAGSQTGTNQAGGASLLVVGEGEAVVAAGAGGEQRQQQLPLGVSDEDLQGIREVLEQVSKFDDVV